MEKRSNKKRRKINTDSILPRSGLNPAIIPDKGPNAWNSFNSMNSGSGDISACFESINDMDERSNVSIYVDWKNPYTEKVESRSIYVPIIVLDRVIPIWLKDNYNIEGKEKDIKRLFYDLNVSDDELEYSESLCSLAKEEYLKSEYYKRDSEYFLDEYEMLNDLGEYSEDDEYVG